MLEVNLNKDYINLERLHGWHNTLFEYIQSKTCKIKRANFRDNDIQIISDLPKKTQIHYKALPVEA
ncbi:hypothetical protein [Campylobacter concisus]|uniref:hypothetical protein n=1 Tax=Campylobacter concisus TaxID=199 RepID=UPI0011E8389C|nr:hypothetical protein [Campylobacter concisus]